MKKFLYLYSGGNAPATPEAGRKMMDPTSPGRGIPA